MQQKSLKVSPEVYGDLKAYAEARGGLPLGRAIETLLEAEKQRRFWAGVKAQVPDEQYRIESDDAVGLVDAEEHVALLEARDQ